MYGVKRISYKLKGYNNDLVPMKINSEVINFENLSPNEYTVFIEMEDTLISGKTLGSMENGTYFMQRGNMRVANAETSFPYVVIYLKTTMNGGDVYKNSYKCRVTFEDRPAKGSSTGQKKYSYEENTYEDDKQYGEEWLVKVEPE